MCWFVFETVSSPLVFCHCDSDRWLESQRCGVLSARGWCFWMLGSNSHSKSTIVWLVVSFIFYVPFHIWDVILPIDELIFFKMVIAPPTSCDRQVLLEMMRFPHPPNIFENCWFFLWIFVWKPWASEVFPVQTYLMAFDGPWWYLSCVAHHGVCLRFLCMCPDGYMNQKKLSRFFKKMCLFLIHHIHHIYIYISYIIYIYIICYMFLGVFFNGKSLNLDHGHPPVVGRLLPRCDCLDEENEEGKPLTWTYVGQGTLGTRGYPG